MKLGDWATYQGQLGLVTRIDASGWVSLAHSPNHSMCGAPGVRWVRDGDEDVRVMLERAEAGLRDAGRREMGAALEMQCVECGEPEARHHTFVPGANFEDAKARYEQAGADWMRACDELTAAKTLAFGRGR